MALSADDVVRLLRLAPHPEGGYFRETFRDVPGSDGRSRSTAIFYLVRAGERSHWHRIDAMEIWHFHAGASLSLRIVTGSGAINTIRLGADLAAGEVPQAVVPLGAWQSAESLGDWTLAGCTVSPGFRFEGFELAPEGWEPDADLPR